MQVKTVKVNKAIRATEASERETKQGEARVTLDVAENNA